MKETCSQSEFYANKEFWNDRFEKSKGSFDWYVGWKELKPYLEDLIDFTDKILMVGCGNSKMSEMMYKDSYRNITNIDISNIVVDKMKSLYQDDFEEMMCKPYLMNIYSIVLEMDATSMSFEDNFFDLTIDKGTLDALMCSKNPDLPCRLLTEMFRVTKIGSYFAVITYGEPELRLKFFMEALPKYKYELSCKQISLSFLSNLINSLRNNSSDFSVTNALKDKDVLVSSLFDACTSKLEDELKSGNNLTPEQVSAKKKKLLNMKIMKLAFKKKNNLLKEEKQEDKFSKEKTIENPTANEEKKTRKNSDALVKIENSLNPNNETNEENENDENPNKMNVRRTFCYLYLFKKVDD